MKNRKSKLKIVQKQNTKYSQPSQSGQAKSSKAAIYQICCFCCHIFTNFTMKQNVLTPGKVQILRKSTTKDILIYGAPLKKLGHEGGSSQSGRSAEIARLCHRVGGRGRLISIILF